MSDWQQKIEAQIALINNYLGNGGFFNPELMDHNKVRDMVMGSRTALQALLDVAVAAQLLTDSLRVVEERDDRNLSNATKLARQNDALLRLRVALDKLREVE